MLMYLSLKHTRHIFVWLIFAAAFYAMRDGLRERPQMFTYLLTAVYVLILRSKNAKTMWMIPLLQALWANLHGAACFIGLGLVILFAVAGKDTDKRSGMLLLAAAAAASLANPFGYKIFTYLFMSFSRGLTAMVMEFHGPVLSAQFIPFYALLAVTAVSFILAGKEPSWETAAVFFAAAGSLSAIRNIPVFAVIAAPLAAENISLYFARRRSFFDNARPPAENRWFRNSFAAAGVMGAALVILFWTAGQRMDVTGKYRFGLGDEHKARYAAEFMKWCAVKGFTGQVFNDYDYGGYLIWKLYPLQKVFIDGRLFEYGGELAQKSFYFWKPAVWRELDGKYDFSAVVVPNERYYSCANLDGLKEWALVYWDDDSLVYFKDNPRNRDFISKYGYRILKPNNPNQNYLKEYAAGNALREIERSLYFSPGSKKAMWMKKFLCGN